MHGTDGEYDSKQKTRINSEDKDDKEALDVEKVQIGSKSINKDVNYSGM